MRAFATCLTVRTAVGHHLSCPLTPTHSPQVGDIIDTAVVRAVLGAATGAEGQPASLGSTLLLDLPSLRGVTGACSHMDQHLHVWRRSLLRA